METIIKRVTIVDPQGPHHGKCKDVLIQDGTIQAIEDTIEAPRSAEVWSEEGAHLSIGWMDLQADFGDPGNEQKEGLENGLHAAAAGGFAHVLLNVSQVPVPDNKAAIAYLRSRSQGFQTALLPMGTVSKGRLGQELAELYDLADAGAIAFSDDAPIDRTELLRRALEYTSEMTQPVMVCPVDFGLNAEAHMHEGETSTHMGVTGNPTVSETMRIQRDLEVLRYTGGRLHFSCISAGPSVELIRAAKKEGLAVTCATSAHHLFFIDEDLAEFDGTLKVVPPFRGAIDRKALCKGVVDGTIDAIISDHRPEDLEHHDVEFALSPFGIAGIESVYPVARAGLQTSPEPTEPALIRALTSGPRAVLGWESPVIQVGSKADLTWYHPSKKWSESYTTKGVNCANYTNRKHPFEGVGMALGMLRSKR